MPTSTRPTDSEDTPEESISLEHFSSLIDNLVKNTKKPDHIITVFHAVSEPTISILEYLKRFKPLKINEDDLTTILIYLDRYIHYKPGVAITYLNIHRLLACIIYIEQKFVNDEYYKIGYYAVLAGIPKEELYRFEADFLFSIAFELYVDEVTFDTYKRALIHYSLTALGQAPIQMTDDKPLMDEQKQPLHCSHSKPPRHKACKKKQTVQPVKSSYSPRMMSPYVRDSKKIGPDHHFDHLKPALCSLNPP